MPKRPPPDSVIEARRRFLAEGGVPREKIRLPILRSWQRGAGRGLDMEAKPEIYILQAHELREAQERHEGLIRAARGELEVLFRDASVTDAIVIPSQTRKASCSTASARANSPGMPQT